MSKTLGWVIKAVSWIAIYFVFSMLYDGEMPFGIYFLVVFLCVVVAGVVEYFVKKGEKKKNNDAESTGVQEQKDTPDKAE